MSMSFRFVVVAVVVAGAGGERKFGVLCVYKVDGKIGLGSEKTVAVSKDCLFSVFGYRG